MRRLTALKGERLLAAWESGSNRTIPGRALTLLAGASDGWEWEELMELSLAARDLELLRLRQITFGDTLRGTLPCPACGTRLETEISVQSMIDRLEALRPTSRATVAACGFTLLMRPVNSRDL